MAISGSEHSQRPLYIASGRSLKSRPLADPKVAARYTDPSKDFYDVVITLISHQGEMKHWKGLHEAWMKHIDHFRGDFTVLLLIVGGTRPGVKIKSLPDYARILDCGNCDGYAELTQKTSAARLYVVHNYNFNFYLKLDSDLLPNFRQIFNFFREETKFDGQEVIYCGEMYTDKGVVNDKDGEWGKYADPDFYRILHHYPRYANGPGYGMSYNAVAFLAHCETQPFATQRRMFNEDAFVGVMLASRNTTYKEWKVWEHGDFSSTVSLNRCVEMHWCHDHNSELETGIKIMQTSFF